MLQEVEVFGEHCVVDGVGDGVWEGGWVCSGESAEVRAHGWIDRVEGGGDGDGGAG